MRKIFTVNFPMHFWAVMIYVWVSKNKLQNVGFYTFFVIEVIDYKLSVKHLVNWAPNCICSVVCWSRLLFSDDVLSCLADMAFVWLYRN